MLAAPPRLAKAALALLAGLLVGGFLGGGAVWVLNRNSFKDPNTIHDVSLAKASELDLVPADGLAFAHVRLADMWRTDAMSEFRKVLEKAGPDAIKAFDEGFVPAPSSADRLTVFGFKSNEAPPPPPNVKGGFAPQPTNSTHICGILAFSAPFDEARVREANIPGAGESTANGKKFWSDPATDLAIHFHSDRVIVVGPSVAVRAFLSLKPAKEGPLANALALAASGGRHVVAAASTSLASGPLPVNLPNEVSPLLRADSVSMGLVFGGGAKLDIRASYKTAAEAENAEKALRNAAAEGRKKIAEMKTKFETELKGNGKVRPVRQLPEAAGSLFGLGAMNTFDEWLADPPLVRDGSEIAATFTMGSLGGTYLGVAAMSVGLMLPAVDKVREAAARASDSNNLKMIGLAMHSYSDTYGRLPNPSWGTKVVNGQPTGNLSWRVALLPYLEHDALYRQFKLDEPWDSEHNKKLIPLMPKVYSSPVAPTPPGLTHYKAFVGPQALFSRPATRYGVSNIPDGSSNTIMVVEGGTSVTWTKPDDFEFDPTGALPPIAPPGKAGFNALLADGSVRFIRSTIPEATLKLLIQPADGMVLPLDW